jgi:hypothetical protein
MVTWFFLGPEIDVPLVQRLKNGPEIGKWKGQKMKGLLQVEGHSFFDLGEEKVRDCEAINRESEILVRPTTGYLESANFCWLEESYA